MIMMMMTVMMTQHINLCTWQQTFVSSPAYACGLAGDRWEREAPYAAGIVHGMNCKTLNSCQKTTLTARLFLQLLGLHQLRDPLLNVVPVPCPTCAIPATRGLGQRRYAGPHSVADTPEVVTCEFKQISRNMPLNQN